MSQSSQHSEFNQQQLNDLEQSFKPSSTMNATKSGVRNVLHGMRNVTWNVTGRQSVPIRGSQQSHAEMLCRGKTQHRRL